MQKYILEHFITFCLSLLFILFYAWKLKEIKLNKKLEM